ncbi:hypothetical protein [Mycolicibacterium thermoresistibile]|uniref:Transmembrane protein n=2 Tax=Mycolicibacterium thermoresistibile TaxID=1797 RepID=G7CHL7_MYCT3|nr:hypothetical protein [Mycolicibacterium thermoresistibile]EHI12327.1 hypothetical protein KEK_15548 [Mycolicibacterium thermoresistibile ATCC 19527]MCV7190964.1 hypothetical protein [Mycolicibacterium thermoresistibile]GAT15696.1 putative uncharacterized protein [Mycolicibacterium thermoresistibile]SNW16755.1 transmembrane protein [Mycolicibacterium thermoresistibile]
MPDRRSETLPGEPTGQYTPVFDTGSFTAVQPDDPARVWEADPVKPLAAEFEPATDSPQTGDVPIGELPSEPIPAPARPMVVPGSYQFLKRWVFALVVAGVWTVAAAGGLGLYHWWYVSLDKTPTVATLLIYLMVSTVAGMLLAMVQTKPVVSGLAIALMSAPFASTMAAAALHGAYYFNWLNP